MSIELKIPHTFSTEVLTCPKHPKYTASKKPRTACVSCWYLYFQADNARRGDAYASLQQSLKTYA